MVTADALNAMTDGEYKVFENRLRRAAQRQGLRLTKSARRDPRAIDYCTYWLSDATGAVVVGHGNGVGLDDIERALMGCGE